MNVILAYTNLNRNVEKFGKETADVVEDMLRALEQGRTSISKQIIPPMQKADELHYKQFVQEEQDKEKKRKLRKQIIKQQLDKEKEKKQNEEKKKNDDLQKLKKEKEDKLVQQLMKERKIRQEIKAQINISKKKKIDEKLNEEKKEIEVKQEIEKKKEVEKLSFLTKQRRKLKEQFKSVKNVRNNIVQQREEIMNAGFKLPEVNIVKVLTKDKDYVEFEKILNDKLEELLNRSDIKEYLANYEGHFRTIYDVYSKFSLKISHFNKEAIHLHGFKEFLLNFTVLGLLVNTEQMTYIFRKVCRRNQGEQEEQFFLKFNDFMLCIMYLSIFSKFTNKARRILPTDLEKVDQNTVKTLIDFLGLNLPYDKISVENFINDRRALSAKQLFKLQNQLKKDKVSLIKPKRQPSARKFSIKKNNFIAKSPSKERKIAEIPLSQLGHESPNPHEKIISPEGNPESWKLKK